MNYIPQKIDVKAALYIVATPIGNLKDISFRGLDILHSVNNIACEDSRVTQKLVSAYQIETPLIPYHDFSQQKDRYRILNLLEDGNSVALVSDAGTPLISDPGYKLVEAVREKNFEVISIPGACAAISALVSSGLPSNRFIFEGFLPTKNKDREQILNQYLAIDATIIFYESGRKLLATLKNIQQFYPNAKISVARELTKKFEEIKTASVQELLEYYTNNPTPKGEITLLLSHTKKSTNSNSPELESFIKHASSYLSSKDTAEFASKIFGVKKKDVYQAVLEQSQR